MSDNWAIFENAHFKGIIFLYDEFRTVVDDKRNKQYVLSDFLGAINEIQKEGRKYFVVLCGIPNLQLNVKKARSYSERMYRSIKVGNLDHEAATLAIEKALEGNKLQVPAAIGEIDGRGYRRVPLLSSALRKGNYVQHHDDL